MWTEFENQINKNRALCVSWLKFYATIPDAKQCEKGLYWKFLPEQNWNGNRIKRRRSNSVFAHQIVDLFWSSLVMFARLEKHVHLFLMILIRLRISLNARWIKCETAAASSEEWKAHVMYINIDMLVNALKKVTRKIKHMFSIGICAKPN